MYKFVSVGLRIEVVKFGCTELSKNWRNVPKQSPSIKLDNVNQARGRVGEHHQ